MLGWLQELGARGASSGFDYSGCLTLPRVLSRRGAALPRSHFVTLILEGGPCWRPKPRRTISRPFLSLHRGSISSQCEQHPEA